MARVAQQCPQTHKPKKCGRPPPLQGTLRLASTQSDSSIGLGSYEGIFTTIVTAARAANGNTAGPAWLQRWAPAHKSSSRAPGAGRQASCLPLPLSYQNF